MIIKDVWINSRIVIELSNCTNSTKKMKKIISFLAIMFMTAIMFVNFIVPAHAVPMVSVDSSLLGSIYIGNLSYEVTENDLKEVFADYGTVERVYVPLDRETGRMRGFAFVEMASPQEEEIAIETLDGAEWMGRTMNYPNF